MIPQSFLQDLLGRVDLVDVIGRTVKLKKSGSNWQGLCPFHSEKSPSFSVSPVKQFYHCFGCGANGNAIGFLMEIGGLSFVEAVDELAAGVGLSVPHEPRGGGRPGSGFRSGDARGSGARPWRGSAGQGSGPGGGPSADRRGPSSAGGRGGAGAGSAARPERGGRAGSRVDLEAIDLSAEAAEAASREVSAEDDPDVGLDPIPSPDASIDAGRLPPEPPPPAFDDAGREAGRETGAERFDDDALRAGPSRADASDPDSARGDRLPDARPDGDGSRDQRPRDDRTHGDHPRDERSPDQRPRDDRGRRDRGAEQRLLALLDQAAAHYRRQLRASARAIDYLKARGLTGEAAARFGLGFAPDGWRGLEALATAPLPAPAAAPASASASASRAGSGGRGPGPGRAGARGPVDSPRFDYADAAFIDAGLVISPEAGKRYDRFRDRIMFPIRDVRGRTIGFGGRVLDKSEPKYLNSPETPVFVKGRELYGLFEARQAIRQKNEVLVVEGYMDVVMLHQHGVSQAVAALGTATTEEHVIKLSRLADRIVFAFDGDAAGRRAASRALQTVLPRVADSRRFDFLFLPPDHDPDSFIRDNGVAAFERELADATPLSAFVLREVGTDFRSPEDRSQALVRFRDRVLLMPDTALRTQLIHAVADRVGFGLAELLDFLGLKPPQPVSSGADWRGQRGWSHRGGSGWRGDGEAGRGGGGAGFGPSGARDAGAGGFGPGFGGPGARDAGRGRFGGAGDRDRRFGPGRGPAAGAVPRGIGAAPVSLTARLCGLLAMHPDLATVAVIDALLPPAVHAWRDRIEALGDAPDRDRIIAALREAAPREADALLRSGNDRLGVIADLTFEQARTEYLEAIRRLEIARLKAEKTTLAGRGLETAADEARYEALLRQLAELDKPADDRGEGESGVLDI